MLTGLDLGKGLSPMPLERSWYAKSLLNARGICPWLDQTSNQHLTHCSVLACWQPSFRRQKEEQGERHGSDILCGPYPCYLIE